MNDSLQLPIDVCQIQELLPHRYPFLLVDRVLELDVEAKRILAQKNVSINEPFFQGHFPGRPIMPGVLIIEALAQAGGLAVAQRELPDGHPEGGVGVHPLAVLDGPPARFELPINLLAGLEFGRHGRRPLPVRSTHRVWPRRVVTVYVSRPTPVRPSCFSSSLVYLRPAPEGRKRGTELRLFLTAGVAEHPSY